MAASYYWDAIEPYRESISIHEDPASFLASYRKTPATARHLLCAHWCQSEVCNGGFMQFFFNHTGVLAPEAAIGFEAIGLPGLAACVRDGIEFFGRTYPRDCVARREILNRHEDDPFESLDRRFYALIDSESSGWEAAANAFAARPMQ